MVSGKSRRNPSARLPLLLGALVLLALLLTVLPSPAQASSHVTSNQSCTDTNHLNEHRRPAPEDTLVSIDLGDCITNHGSGDLTHSLHSFELVGRTDLGQSDVLTNLTMNSGFLFAKAKTNAQLSAITPRLGTAVAGNPGAFEFEWNILVRGTNSGGSSAGVWVHFKSQYIAQATTDYDSDDDGLIEISNAAQLNAIRWDVDGDGGVDAANQTAYDAAFPNKTTDMGCPITTQDDDNNDCLGYEIGTSSSAADVNIDLNVDPHNANMGWAPIPGFAATFEGNGNTISSLFINRTAGNDGLFGSVTSAGKVRNVGLTGVNVTGGNSTGGLVGSNAGAISGSYVEGSVTTAAGLHVGGLVGENTGAVTTSSAAAAVSGGAGAQLLGGLVGKNTSGSITASYATGAVSGDANSIHVGGLAGRSTATIQASYASGAVRGGDRVGGLAGSTSTASVITASYSTGLVTGATFTGGLLGIKNGTVTASYWDTTTSGQAASPGARARPPASCKRPPPTGPVPASTPTGT